MKISILTICRNNLEGLRTTGKSIISQSCKDYEWIVIDGDSNDGTKQYLEQIRPHTSYCISEPDNGIYDAMNKGIDLSKGEYLLFMNSGDSFVDADSLQAAVRLFPEEGDVLYADAIYHYEDCSKEIVHPDEFCLHHFWLTYCPCHQATFVRRELLQESSGYDSSYRICADYKQWLLWMVSGKKFVHLPVVITNYMANGISSTNIALHRQEHDRAIHETLSHNDITMMRYIDSIIVSSNNKDKVINRLSGKLTRKRRIIFILSGTLLIALLFIMYLFIK